MRYSRNVAFMGALLALGSTGAVVADPPAQVSTADKPPAPVESRQVRRYRERTANSPHKTTFWASGLTRDGNRSKYMPHIGAKERGRYASPTDSRGE